MLHHLWSGLRSGGKEGGCGGQVAGRGKGESMSKVGW
jgi:hypothetical protein